MPTSNSGSQTGASSNTGPVTGLAGLANMDTPMDVAEEPYAETLVQEDGTPLPPDPSTKTSLVQQTEETDEPTETPQETQTPQENLIEELETALKDPTQQTPTQQQTPQTPQVQTPAQNRRDFTGLPEAEHQHWKRMDQRSFDFLAPLRKEHIAAQAKLAEVEKSLSDAAGYRFYQHENAYMLSPKYAELFSAQQALKTQADYWQEALAKLDNGEPIRDLLIDKDGKMSLGAEELEATPQLRAQVIRMLHNVETRRIQAEGEASAYAEKHKTQFKRMTSQIEQATKALYDPLTPEIKAEGEKFLKNFPAEVQHLPEFKALAASWTFIQLQNAELTKLREQLKVRAAKKKAINSQGPGEGAAGSASSGPGSSLPADGDKLFEKMSALAHGET